MARRSDRRTSDDTRASARGTSRAAAQARGARQSQAQRSARQSQKSRTQQPQAERARTRSHGSSRPESAAHQGGYARQTARKTTRQPSSRTRQRADVRKQSQSSEAFSAVSGGKRADAPTEERYVSRSVGEIRRDAREEREARMKKSSRRRVIRIVALVAFVAALVVGGVVLYNSPAFAVTNVTVNGVEHLTSDEMAQLANVPADTTLLRVDTDTIEKRIEQNAWVADAHVNRVFPDTLEINVTERSVFAVVEVPTAVGASVKQWAIASDHVWLMPIPELGTDGAKTTSAKVYEDAERALHIVDVPFGTKAEIGQECTDANINNALDIVSGLTTELSGRIAEVSAAGTAETTLILDSGVEVAFGKAEDIRDKERVILQILEENEDNVAYINVRMVENPTWRSV